mmetsp:Transcript_8551/g.19809  ORF Transcript_8551/g.19809 Transcript_8551/m.19809 type:complete len:128 (+) Transcript_8551:235-618(+)
MTAGGLRLQKRRMNMGHLPNNADLAALSKFRKLDGKNINCKTRMTHRVVPWRDYLLELSVLGVLGMLRGQRSGSSQGPTSRQQPPLDRTSLRSMIDIAFITMKTYIHMRKRTSRAPYPSRNNKIWKI